MSDGVLDPNPQQIMSILQRVYGKAGIIACEDNNVKAVIKLAWHAAIESYVKARDGERQTEIQAAMNRYISANMAIPAEWWEELNEIMARQRARISRGGISKEPSIC